MAGIVEDFDDSLELISNSPLVDVSKKIKELLHESSLLSPRASAAPQQLIKNLINKESQEAREESYYNSFQGETINFLKDQCKNGLSESLTIEIDDQLINRGSNKNIIITLHGTDIDGNHFDIKTEFPGVVKLKKTCQDLADHHFLGLGLNDSSPQEGQTSSEEKRPLKEIKIIEKKKRAITSVVNGEKKKDFIIEKVITIYPKS